MALRQLTVLGATGSVGTSTLDVVRQHPDRYCIYALTAHSQIDQLFTLCQEFRPKLAIVSTAKDAAKLQTQLRASAISTEVSYGPQALIHVASADDVDIVVAAIVGAAGLPATLAAAQTGKRILLANKEALVMSGQLFMQAAKNSGAELLPIDSEHNAIFQCLPAHAPYYSKDIEEITLTASGGPFRTRSAEYLETVTPEQACAHPNWVMGRKISVDSATMMNKGFEVIEAHWLFSVPAQRIAVVIHPQSIVHSMVAYTDGSVLAQLGNPDMRTPIAHALAYPERLTTSVRRLNLTQYGKLEFEALDPARFPCLSLAFDALREGGGAAVLLNAANEIAVSAFLNRQIRFTAIAKILYQTLLHTSTQTPESLDAILALDQEARIKATDIVRQHQYEMCD
ncbi:MAG: 1-deoxy-D-xylulose-5-phosphate reductoisomerase [Ottowia sp.]|nr:1-deoxy-D-xylulose-5-phosphate reductoisomerase [Ottowia sp.]